MKKLMYCLKSNPWSGLAEFDTIDEVLSHARNLLAAGYSVELYTIEVEL